MKLPCLPVIYHQKQGIECFTLGDNPILDEIRIAFLDCGHQCNDLAFLMSPDPSSTKYRVLPLA